MHTENAILEYYDWLCARIAIPKPEEYGYGQLMAQMMMFPFEARVQEDEHRIEDALYLRRQFARSFVNFDEQKRDFYRALGPCSVLEIFVILVEKMSFELDGNRLADNTPSALFLELIDNLDLCYLTDDAFKEDPIECSEELGIILSTFVNRTYDQNGGGSAFPLKTAKTDMAQIGLVQQMDLYLIEKYDILS